LNPVRRNNVGFAPRNQVLKFARGGLVFKAHRLVHHSTLGLRVTKKRRRFARVIWLGKVVEIAAPEGVFVMFLALFAECILVY